MPELPDVTVYVECLQRDVVGHVLRDVQLRSPFVLRTVVPTPAECVGKRAVGARRVGKRVVLALEDDLFVVMHLMILGRLSWTPEGAKLPRAAALATFAFDNGLLRLTESGSKHRAALHVVRGEDALRALDAGGIEPLAASLDAFAQALRRESHTLKRSLTDPRVVAGIGNAYSDEILHRARLSPMKLTSKMDDAEMARLHEAMRAVLTEWTERLREEARGAWPAKVTAFHEGMAVHGRFGQPCPVCETPVQRIVRGESESNYCPRCQTDGRMLSDRALARLMHDDWPKTIDEWERRMPPKSK